MIFWGFTTFPLKSDILATRLEHRVVSLRSFYWKHNKTNVMFQLGYEIETQSRLKWRNTGLLNFQGPSVSWKLFSGCLINAVVCRMRLIMHYLNTWGITVCILGHHYLLTNSECRSKTPVWSFGSSNSSKRLFWTTMA